MPHRQRQPEVDALHVLQGAQLSVPRGIDHFILMIRRLRAPRALRHRARVDDCRRCRTPPVQRRVAPRHNPLRSPRSLEQVPGVRGRSALAFARRRTARTVQRPCSASALHTAACRDRAMPSARGFLRQVCSEPVERLRTIGNTGQAERGTQRTSATGRLRASSSERMPSLFGPQMTSAKGGVLALRLVNPAPEQGARLHLIGCAVRSREAQRARALPVHRRAPRAGPALSRQTACGRSWPWGPRLHECCLGEGDTSRQLAACGAKASAG
jgi:hypothetical protein